jgi:deazaflavin-dependent oxidoreductase (nitroreductase family)
MSETIEGTYVPNTMDWVSEQVAAYEASGGQEANTLMDTGIPIIVVTMRGAKTGAVRKIGLMRVEHDGEYAIIASYGGSPKNPVWYYNLLAHPDEIFIQDGPTPFRVTVREVEGDERTLWWDRSVAVYPSYADYQAGTDRVIPVLVATPA